MTNRKDTNPKDAVGVKKVPIHVIPFQVLAEVGVALLEGARKYGSYNWRKSGVRASVYFDAQVGRHLSAWWDGEDLDSDSGISHVTKAIAGLIILRDSMIQENWVDDRPIKGKQGWIQELNKKAEDIIARYPDALPPYTEKSQNPEYTLEFNSYKKLLIETLYDNGIISHKTKEKSLKYLRDNND